MQPTVGLIGVGLVGLALAESLQRAGWEVVGFDVEIARCNELRRLGCRVASDAHEVIASTDTILLSLPTSAISREVLAAAEGQLSGKIIVDTTTGEPEEMASIGERLATQGARYLDATIAGSSAQVRTGEVVVMVGGEQETATRCDGLFRSFAAHTFHVGSWGAGARMKLVVNLVLGLNRAVLAEGLAFAERSGVDPRQALEVLRSGPAFSRVMEIKGEKMLTGDYVPQARLAQHLKDVRLILSAGQKNGATLPLSTLHAQLLEQLDRAGCGALDNSAIMKAFR